MSGGRLSGKDRNAEDSNFFRSKVLSLLLSEDSCEDFLGDLDPPLFLNREFDEPGGFNDPQVFLPLHSPRYAPRIQRGFIAHCIRKLSLKNDV